MSLIDVNTLLANTSTPPPRPPNDLARLRIADIVGLTADQVLQALYLIVQDKSPRPRDHDGHKAKGKKCPVRYLTCGALIARIKANHLWVYWGYSGLRPLLRGELPALDPNIAHRTFIVYQRASNLGFTTEEMEDMEHKYPWMRTMSCVKHAVNKKHCLLALNSYRCMRMILYAAPRNRKSKMYLFGPFNLPLKRHLVLSQVYRWFIRECNVTGGDTLIAMALIIQSWLEKPPLERQRFLRAQLKELDINPEIAERFF